jgi:hypothetical protein
MGNGWICALTGYCPAPLAPDNAPKTEDLKNKTVKRQVTVEQAKALPITAACNGVDKVLDSGAIKRITIEEPMNQSSSMDSKSVILTIEQDPIKTKDGTTVQATHYCSHKPSDSLYKPLSVINYTSENPDTVVRRTDIGTSGVFGSSYRKTTTELEPTYKKEVDKGKKLVTFDVYRELGTNYQSCFLGHCSYIKDLRS